MMLGFPCLTSNLQSLKSQFAKEHIPDSNTKVHLTDSHLFLIGPVMAFLSITLKNSMNRWANIILGVFITGLGLFTTVEYLAEQSAYSACAALIEVVGVVFSALIVCMLGSLSRKRKPLPTHPFFSFTGFLCNQLSCPRQ
jgi:hypothetical protein